MPPVLLRATSDTPRKRGLQSSPAQAPAPLRRATGGRAALMRLAQTETTGTVLATLAAVVVISLTAAITIFIATKGLATFTHDGVRLRDFLFSARWAPDRTLQSGGPQVGVFAFLLGSVIVSVLAALVSAPLGIACAVFIVEIAPGWGRRVLQPAIEILAGIPSVVYGYVGLSVLVPFIRTYIGGLGFSVLAAFLVLSVMILPTIVSVSTNCLRGLPSAWKEASYALGSTRWQAIRLVLAPAARFGLMTGVVLGLARAFGEALAVQMVIGNTRAIPTSILAPATTLTSAITMDMGNTPQGSLWSDALWSMGLLLLVVSFSFILLARFIVRKEVVIR